MADTALPPFSRVGTRTDGDISPDARLNPLSGDPSENRVRRLKQRFFAAWHHPKWVRHREESKEDMGFHSGVGQWDEALKRKLNAQGRPAITINRIRSVNETVIGFERASRVEPRPVPDVVGNTPPDELAKDTISVFARLLKKVVRDQEAQHVESDGFKDGEIGGLGAWHVGIDYSDDLVHGRPCLCKIRPGDLVYSPSADRYDLEDATEVFWHKLVPLEMLTGLYPDQEDDIEAALRSLPPNTPGATHELPTRNPTDGYKTVPGEIAMTLWDPEYQEVRIIEAWYQVWNPVHLLLNRETSSVEEVEEGSDALALARDLASGNPNVYKVVAKRRRSWETSIFLPATNYELAASEDGEHPFPNDRENCPIVQFLAYRGEDDEVLGVTRNLKDPQREVNKRRSALIDNVARSGKTKWFAQRGVLENPEFLEGGMEAGEVGWTRGNPSQNRPIEVGAPEMPNWVLAAEGLAVRDIPDVSGVHNAMVGKQESASSSARKELALQQGGQVQLSEIFDNLKRSRRLIYARLGKRIQQCFTGEMGVDLETDAGTTEFVTLNQRHVDENGVVSILRDIPSLAWKMEMAEGPTTPTAKAATQVVLLEYANQFPDFKDAVADLVAETLDIPNRHQFVQRIRAVQQAKGIIPGPGQVPGQVPGQGPAGVPPGGPQGPLPGAPTNGAARPVGITRLMNQGIPSG